MHQLYTDKFINCKDCAILYIYICCKLLMCVKLVYFNFLSLIFFNLYRYCRYYRKIEHYFGNKTRNNVLNLYFSGSKIYKHKIIIYCNNFFFNEFSQKIKTRQTATTTTKKRKLKLKQKIKSLKKSNFLLIVVWHIYTSTNYFKL